MQRVESSCIYQLTQVSIDWTTISVNILPVPGM
jgi:hypothetical protein